MSNKYVRGFVFGSLMGMAAGMLLMPQVKEDTKKKMLHKGMDMVENASHMMPRMGRR